MNLCMTICCEPGPPTTNDTTTLQKKTAIVQTRRTSAGQTVLIAGLSAVLIFAVLAYGIFDQWVIAILEVGSALLLLFWIWPQISSGCLQLRTNRLYLPIMLFGAIIIVQVILGTSAYVYVTRHELWKYGSYWALFLLANQCTRTGTHRLLTILA